MGQTQPAGWWALCAFSNRALACSQSCCCGCLLQINSAAADQPVGTIRPRKASIKAHRVSMHMMLGHGNSCVTIGSLGSIKLWGVEQLQQEGARQGLSTLPSLNLAKAMSAGTSEFGR